MPEVSLSADESQTPMRDPYAAVVHRLMPHIAAADQRRASQERQQAAGRALAAGLTLATPDLYLLRPSGEDLPGFTTLREALARTNKLNPAHPALSVDWIQQFADSCGVTVRTDLQRFAVQVELAAQQIRTGRVAGVVKGDRCENWLVQLVGRDGLVAWLQDAFPETPNLDLMRGESKAIHGELGQSRVRAIVSELHLDGRDARTVLLEPNFGGRGTVKSHIREVILKVRPELWRDLFNGSPKVFDTAWQAARDLAKAGRLPTFEDAQKRVLDRALR